MFKNYCALSATNVVSSAKMDDIIKKCLKTMAPQAPKCCDTWKDGRYSKNVLKLFHLKHINVVFSAKD